jgi:hypothetical protein
MTHPTREDWMSFLYDELEPDQRENYQAHLAVCPACKRQVDAWRGTQTELAHWSIPPQVHAVPSTPFPWRWAAAAAVLLLASGFALGRFATPAVDTAALRQELRSELAAELRADLRQTAQATLATARDEARDQVAEFARYYEQNRTEDQQALARTATRLETKQASDHASLRKDLETVAVLTEAGFRQTQQQLVDFADARPVHRP